MKIYSWFVLVDDGGFQALTPDVMHRWALHAELCCDPETPKAGHIVEVSYTVGKSNIEKSADIEQHPDYIGATAEDRALFESWLIGRGVPASKAAEICAAADIHDAMHDYIKAQQ